MAFNRRDLEDTNVLAAYFPNGFEFGVDPYDPTVDEILFQTSLQPPGLPEEQIKEFAGSNEVVEILLRGMKRHITTDRRYALFTAISALERRVAKKDRQYVHRAIEALKDSSVPPPHIGIMMNLYSHHIFSRAYKRNRNYDDNDMSLVEAAIANNRNEDILQRALASEETFLNAAKAKMAELNTQDTESLVSVLTKFPSYHAANILQDICWSDNASLVFDSPFIAESPVTPFLADYFLGNATSTTADIPTRLTGIEGLVQLKDYRVVPSLRHALLTPTSTIEDPDGLMDSLIMTATRGYIALNDRRGIPTLIEAFYRSRDLGLTEDLVATLKDIINRESKWRDEIERGLKLLEEGKPILIRTGQHMPGFLPSGQPRKEGETIQLMGMEMGSHTDIAAAMEMANLSNRAYHEDLGWLRPIDLPQPEIKRALMERMYRELEKKQAEMEKYPRNEQMARFQEAMRKFMLSPLADHGGDFPLSLILKATRDACSTEGARQYERQYMDNELNQIFLEADQLYESGNIQAARLRINAILQIDPSQPFAKHLAGLIAKSKTTEKPTATEPHHAILHRTDMLRPFFYDQIWKLRPAMRESIGKELISLTTSGQSGPFTDQGSVLFLKDAIAHEVNTIIADEASTGTPEEALGEIASQIAMTVAYEYFALLNFEFHGRKPFYFDPKIVPALMETSLNLEGDFLRLPFKSCAFIFQDPQMIQLFHKCFSETDIVPEYDTPISVFLTEVPRQDHRVLIITAVRLSSDLAYYGLVNRELRINDDRPIEEALRTIWAQDGEERHGTTDDEFFFDDLRITFYRTILNCVLYQDSPNADKIDVSSPLDTLQKQMESLKSPKKKAKLQRRIDDKTHETSSLPYIHVGKNYHPRIPHELAEKTDPATWRKLMKRFMVKGHRKAVAYGKGHSLRRSQWIEPYWKGPTDITEILNKPYIVD